MQSCPHSLTYVLEQTQHFVVSSVIRQKETEIRIAQYGGNADQPSAATRDNCHILPGILALLALSVHFIVQLGNSFSQGLNTSGWTVLSRSDRDINGGRTFEAAGDIIFDLGSTLTQIRPGVGIFEESKFGSALSAPNHTSGSSAGIETSMGEMAFVGVTKLTVDLGLDLCEGVSLGLLITIAAFGLSFGLQSHCLLCILTPKGCEQTLECGGGVQSFWQLQAYTKRLGKRARSACKRAQSSVGFVANKYMPGNDGV